jgi:hypothetical protein
MVKFGDEKSAVFRTKNGTRFQGAVIRRKLRQNKQG